MMRFTPEFILCLLLLSACGGGSKTTSPSPTPPSTTPDIPPIPSSPTVNAHDTSTTEVHISDYRNTPDLSAFQMTESMRTVLAETNRLRAEQGLPALKLDENLSRYATIRAQEAVDDQAAHRRPDGSSAVHVGNLDGYGYTGENLAWGKADAKATVAQWKNSAGHYANMMNSHFTTLGVGYYYDPRSTYKHQWVQIFGSNTIHAPEAQSALSITPEQSRRMIRKAVQFKDKKIHINAPRAPIHDALTGKSGIYAQPHIITHDSSQRFVLRPPQEALWHFQTIGELQHHGRPVAYFNVGEKFTPQADASIKGQYRGYAIGDVGKHSRVIADVIADVDFSKNKKIVNLHLTNTQMAEKDLVGSRQGLHREARLDFHEALTWNTAHARFEGQSANATFYGTEAQEIGGTFKRDYRYNPYGSNRQTTESYQGSYGAKR